MSVLHCLIDTGKVATAGVTSCNLAPPEFEGSITVVGDRHQIDNALLLQWLLCALDHKRRSWPILAIAILRLHDLPRDWREWETVMGRLIIFSIRKRPILNQAVQYLESGDQPSDDSILDNVRTARK